MLTRYADFSSADMTLYLQVLSLNIDTDITQLKVT